MNIRRIVIIFILLVIVIAGVLFIFQKTKDTKTSVKLPETTPSIEQQIEAKFKGLTIPDDLEKIELKNVSGGEGMGIATNKEVLADLPVLSKGESYQVLLSNGSKTIIVGNLKQAKGGYMLSYDASIYSGYTKIFVMKGSERILEGSF